MNTIHVDYDVDDNLANNLYNNLRYAQDMAKIFPRYAQDRPWICPRYTQNPIRRPKNGPQSGQTATYRKSEVIQSHLRIWETYDPIESGPSEPKNGGVMRVA